MSAVYNVLSDLAVAVATLGVCYIFADGARACMVYDTSQERIKKYKETGDRSILERHKETLSKADPHNIGFLTRRTKKDMLREIEALTK
jgi:hypothetical protein